MSGYEQKSFNEPDETMSFGNGSGKLVGIGNGKVGRLTFHPGWRWSNDIKPLAKTESCQAPHFQYQIAGQLHVVMDDGTEFDTHAGDVVMIHPGHDAWVVGDEDVEVVDWGGAHIWGRPLD